MSRPVPGEATSEALTTSVARFSARLRRIEATWKAAIAEARARPEAPSGRGRVSPAEALAQLEADLSALDAATAEHTAAAAGERDAAVAWEGRGIVAIGAGQDQLAKHALAQQAAHTAAAERAAAEVAALAEVRLTYENAIAALRAAPSPPPTEGSRAAI